jgi:hypothetical protein
LCDALALVLIAKDIPADVFEAVKARYSLRTAPGGGPRVAGGAKKLNWLTLLQQVLAETGAPVPVALLKEHGLAAGLKETAEHGAEDEKFLARMAWRSTNSGYPVKVVDGCLTRQSA